MKKIIIFSILICLLTSCASIIGRAKTEEIRLGMSKEEVRTLLKSAYGTAKTASARQLQDGALEESLELTEGYNKYTFIFIDGYLTEWYTIDVRTVIPPAPIIHNEAN